MMLLLSTIADAAATNVGATANVVFVVAADALAAIVVASVEVVHAAMLLLHLPLLLVDVVDFIATDRA